MSQDELYQWIADNECVWEYDQWLDSLDAPVDESPADRFVKDVKERIENGSWRRIKNLLEADNE
jgi:hypothetical protein